MSDWIASQRAQSIEDAVPSVRHRSASSQVGRALITETLMKRSAGSRQLSTAAPPHFASAGFWVWLKNII
ncbi:hypothetical protein EYF80_035668 [Liparis tanakae]|uniref:Uncharacterized protein n=1 Tax=Liparis tanakae TaxID=230148 RepID=A0A4Z2GL95_9TELE|nr:hypothetical protein EYF80_035668 [Liparis tanakae]